MLELTVMLVKFVAGLLTFATAWSLIPRDEWWIRGLDFPRLQLVSVGLVVLVLLVSLPTPWDFWRELLMALLIAALAYQIKMVLPYTKIWPNQVKQVKNLDPTQQLCTLVSNVLTPNNEHYKLIAHIRNFKPDIVLTLESDKVWEQALSGIEPDYPHVVRIPLDNLYGMHLYSRLPLENTEVKFLLSDDIPSIHTCVTLRSGQKVTLYCLHPKPPSPTEAYESTLRDAELLLVGKQIAKRKESCIVMGDLNDVAWSRTTRLFQRISGLLDPRVGRHFINTFHADYPLLRWSLDHVFHSSDFSLVSMQRLSHVGSDHFPVLTRLQYMADEQVEQKPLEASPEDHEEASDKIKEGIEKAEKVPADNLITEI